MLIRHTDSKPAGQYVVILIST